MSASYPTSVKTFAAITNNNTSDASQINEPREEITAIEQDLIAGLPVARGGTGATSVTANRVAHANAGGTALASTAGFTFDGTTLAVPGQIAFPAAQNASSGANTLDDYEEGAWTPVIGGSGGTSGQVYTLQVGKYVKVGKLVHVEFAVTLSTLGTVTGTVEIQGLPFAAENTSNQISAGIIGSWAGMTTAATCMMVTIAPNVSVLTLRGAGAAVTGTTTYAQADLSNTTSFIGSIQYVADA